MKIDKKLILKLEKLSKLELSEGERNRIQGDLNTILEMIEKLDELDTENIEPLIHVSEGENNLRTDEIRNQLSRDQALKNAPNHDEQYFKVPRVIK